ncbi:quinone oxidoreductase putative [Athelia psychrophila]|uniref:Quinone oxidoreductase putative n=1 Tax=Athelia psychrophila TaxID=1759441 RepID=A0A166H4L4_9AGAM|nr:quinone oxidoreductase putative [Fibularhizoctonia sp. CBS 109695]
MPSMRAVLIKDGKGPVENLYIGETAKPTPGPGQLIVKIKAFGLNRMDIIQRAGHYPPPPGASDILGVEFAGTVDALGAGATRYKVGDEVLGLVGGGAYAEYVACAESLVIPKPAHLSWAEAASIPENFLTAFQALILVAALQKGDNVLIHAGASGVGIAAIQLSRVYGAATVTATASSQNKLDALLAMPNGATHVANYKTQDFAEVVKGATGGKGADVVIDFVGQSHWNKNVASMALEGRMTMLGLLSGGEVAKADIAPILFKRLRIQGSTLRSRTLEYQADLVRRFSEEALGKITGGDGDGPLKTYIHKKVYPWTEIQDAQREMQDDKNSGKIIVEVV